MSRPADETLVEHQATLRDWSAALVAHDGALARALTAHQETVGEHAQALAALARLSNLAAGHAAALRAPLAASGLAATGPDAAGEVDPLPTVPAPAPECLPISSLLWRIHTALHHAALGYSILWEIHHRACAVRVEDPLYRLADRHQRAYVEAAQQLVPLIAEVVGWELSRRGQPCRCFCPTCNGLGMCICIAGYRGVVFNALREAAPPEDEAGVVVRQPRPGSPAARAGLKEGDVILAVNDQEVPSVWEIGPLLQPLQQSAQPIRLRIRRRGGATEEVTAVPADAGA